MNARTAAELVVLGLSLLVATAWTVTAVAVAGRTYDHDWPLFWFATVGALLASMAGSWTWLAIDKRTRLR